MTIIEISLNFHADVRLRLPLSYVAVKLSCKLGGGGGGYDMGWEGGEQGRYVRNCHVLGYVADIVGGGGHGVK